MSEDVKNKYLQRVSQYVGQEKGDRCALEMEYDPYEEAVIFRTLMSKEGREHVEIWLDPETIGEMVEELTAFRDTLKKIGIPVDKTL